MSLKTLKSRIQYRISRSKRNVFVPKDFLDLSDRDQGGRVLRQLVAKGLLVKIGQGLYAKAVRSVFSNNIIPVKPLPELATEALINKLNAQVVPTMAEKLYSSGQSTQVPTGRVIGVKGRISRKISFNGISIKFEHAT